VNAKAGKTFVLNSRETFVLNVLWISHCLGSLLEVYIAPPLLAAARLFFLAVFTSVRMEALMSCQICGSGNEAELTAEMLVHFPALKSLDKPAVWLFPKLMVCLDCGCSRFTVPERELASIAHTLEISSPTSESSARDVTHSTSGAASQD
jgi:hypothetical protein